MTSLLKDCFQEGQFSSKKHRGDGNVRGINGLLLIWNK